MQVPQMFLAAWHVMLLPGCARLCYAMLGYAVLQYATLRYVMQCIMHYALCRRLLHRMYMQWLRRSMQEAVQVSYI